jgi:hypothetical protein
MPDAADMAWVVASSSTAAGSQVQEYPITRVARGGTRERPATELQLLFVLLAMEASTAVGRRRQRQSVVGWMDRPPNGASQLRIAIYMCVVVDRFRVSTPGTREHNIQLDFNIVLCIYVTIGDGLMGVGA